MRGVVSPLSRVTAPALGAAVGAPAGLLGGGGLPLGVGAPPVVASAAEAVSDIDPTGAGDAFLAAYAHARSEETAPLEAARAACEHVSALFAGRARTMPQARA